MYLSKNITQSLMYIGGGGGWGKKKIINGMRGKRSYINKGHVISWCTIHTLKGYKQVT